MQASQSFFAMGRDIGQALWMEGVAVAKMLLPAFLVLRLMLGGFAVMWGKEAVANLFVTVVTRSLILYLLVYSPLVQPVLVQMVSQAEKVGMAISEPILRLSSYGGQIGNDLHPLSYWPKWIMQTTGKVKASSAPQPEGSGERGAKPADPNTELAGQFRFSFSNSIRTVWGQEMDLTQVLQEASQNEDRSFMGWLQGLATSIATGGLTNLIQGIGVGLLMALFGMATLFVFVLIVGLIIGLLLLCFFSFLAGYIGPLLLFFITVGLGLMALPLILFDSFKDIWTKYLSLLLSCSFALVLFYLFSAIGFTLTDKIITIVFEERLFANFIWGTLGSPQGQQDLGAAVDKLVAGLAPGVLTNLSVAMGMLANAVEPILKIVMALGMWVSAATVLATIMTMGIAMGGAGASIGFQWANGFASTSIMEYLTQRITQVGQQFQSALSAQLSQGVNQTLMAGRGLSRLGGGAFRLGRAILRR